MLPVGYWSQLSAAEFVALKWNASLKRKETGLVNDDIVPASNLQFLREKFW